MLDGAVRQVSADAQEKTDGTKTLQEAAYRALIHLNSDYLDTQGRRLRLVPGMLVNAGIHLGTRTVFEYLLSPIQKVAYRALRKCLTPLDPHPFPLSRQARGKVRCGIGLSANTAGIDSRRGGSGEHL